MIRVCIGPSIVATKSRSGTIMNRAILIAALALAVTTSFAAAQRAASPDAAAGIATSVRVGDTTQWLEALLGHSPVVSMLSVSPSGRVGAFGATRTSDSRQTGSMSAQGLTGFAINDNRDYVQTAYAGYLEARRYSGAGTTHGLEIAIINRGDTVPASPNAMATKGSTLGLWLSSGLPNITDGTDASLAIGILGGPRRFDSGLVFGNNALAMGAYGGKAIYLGRGHAILWAAPTGGVTGLIRSDASTPGTGGRIIFADDGMYLQDQSGLNVVNVHSGTATIYGSLKLRANNGTMEGFAVDSGGNMKAASLRLAPTTPTSSSAPCAVGQIAADANYMYVCTRPDRWKRTALSEF